MTRAKLVVLSNPVSQEREDEYNAWYNDVHAAEVVALEGISSITRFKALTQVHPFGSEIGFRYLAIYELDDEEKGVRNLLGNIDNFNMSDAIDRQTAVAVTYESIFSYENP